MKRLVVLLTIGLAGCSAQHWGGDTAGKRPGVWFKTGAFYGTEIELTSDGTGNLHHVNVSKTKDGYSLTMDNLTLNQQPSINTTAEVDKLKAIEDLQRVQVEYAREVTQWVRAVSQALIPILGNWQSLLAYGVGNAATAYYTPTTQPAK